MLKTRRIYWRGSLYVGIMLRFDPLALQGSNTMTHIMLRSIGGQHDDGTLYDPLFSRLYGWVAHAMYSQPAAASLFRATRFTASHPLCLGSAYG